VALLSLYVVGGRFRVLTRIVRFLCHPVAAGVGAASAKADRFLAAVRSAVQGVRDDM